MKLVRAEVSRYRSIEEPTAFDIEPDVTSLVGKNESGKTATLQALYKSRPVDKAAFDEGLDYPSHRTRELTQAAGAVEVTVLTYDLDQADIAAVDAQLGAGALRTRSLSVHRKYRGRAVWDVNIDERAVIQHLRGTMELPPTTAAAVDNGHHGGAVR